MFKFAMYYRLPYKRQLELRMDECHTIRSMYNVYNRSMAIKSKALSQLFHMLSVFENKGAPCTLCTHFECRVHTFCNILIPLYKEGP